MKIETKVKVLKEKVGIVGKASNSSSVSGLSEQILFDVKDGVLTLTCYDNNKHFMITTSLNDAGLENGKTLLEYKTLSSLLGKLKLDDTITIETQETKAILRSGRTRLTLDTKNPEGFVVPAVVDTTSNIVVDSDTLKSMVRGVIFAVSSNDNNKMMTGINLVVENGKMSLTALDGHRIAINKTDAATTTAVNLIIEGNLMRMVSDVLKGQITMSFNKTFLVAEDGDTKVILQLIDGTYFNMKQFLSMTGDTTLTVETNELVAAMDRATILIKEGDKKPIVFDLTEKGLTLSIKTQLGESVEDFGAIESTGTIKIAFNPKFLLDALKEIPDKTVTLEMSSPKAPCLIRGENYLYLILPVNFN